MMMVSTKTTRTCLPWLSYQLHGGHILTSRPVLSQKHHKINSCQMMPRRSLNQSQNRSCSYLTMKVSSLWSVTGAKTCIQRWQLWSRCDPTTKKQSNDPRYPTCLLTTVVECNNLWFLDSWHIEVNVMFPDGLVPRELTPVYNYRAETTMLTRGGGYYSSVSKLFDLAKVPATFVKYHSYLTGVTAATPV